MNILRGMLSAEEDKVKKLTSKLTAANERIMELKASLDVRLEQVHTMSKDLQNVHGELAAEREISDKLVAALKVALPSISVCGLHDDLEMARAALAEAAAIRKGEQG